MPNSNPKSRKLAEPFFIGYLPTPTSLKKLYLPLGLLLVAFCGFAGYYVAAAQHSHAHATWDTAHLTRMDGVITADPYPVLHRIHPESGRIQSILLVAQGKHGGELLVDGLVGKGVQVRGYLIQRGNWTMLEIPANAPPQPNSAVNLAQIIPLLGAKNLGDITLRGEIADSKCLLGVMKPGDGKIHRACAEVCLLGGIPPLLVARHADAQRYGYLLTRPDGSSAARHLAGRAATPVRIRGRLQRRGSLLYIVMAEDGVQSLAAR